MNGRRLKRSREEPNSDDSDAESLSHSVYDENEAEQAKQQMLSVSLVEATSTARLAVAANSQTEDGIPTAPANARRGGLLSQIVVQLSTADSNGEGDGSIPTNVDDTPAESRQAKKQDVITQSKKLMCQSAQEILSVKSSRDVSYHSKCKQVIRVFVDMLTRVYIRARHVALIVKWFHIGKSQRTRHFGTYRVELIIYLFGRIVDLHNFDLVIATLSPFEVACLYCRLGILNIFNPMKPEGCICLDLSRREERILVKILALLSVIEPGQNWVGAAFRWEYVGVPMPGWELTQGWMTEEGLPRKGYLFVNYDSGDGKRTRGCIPDVDARKAFLSMVMMYAFV
jgi:hypothetical protein